MASNRLRRHARRTAVVALGAIIGVGIVAFAATSDEPSKPGPVLRPEGSPVSAARANDTAPPLAGTVPARASVPAGVTCPGAWSYFDNPVMHYGLCIPPGWGFSDFHQASPLDQVPAVQLENLHLLGNAFPWHPGALPFDAVRRGTLDVELDILPATARSTDECHPATKKPLGSLTVLTCEQPYDDAGLPAAAGPLRALKVIVPLRSVPSDGMPESARARLLIIARSRAGASPAEVTTLWQIVRSVRPY